MALSSSDRIRGALLGLACGDALGAPVEFIDSAMVSERHGTLRDMVGGCVWAPGEWTDDTGMALAVAEGLLERPGGRMILSRPHRAGRKRDCQVP